MSGALCLARRGRGSGRGSLIIVSGTWPVSEDGLNPNGVCRMFVCLFIYLFSFFWVGAGRSLLLSIDNSSLSYVIR